MTSSGLHVYGVLGGGGGGYLGPAAVEEDHGLTGYCLIHPQAVRRVTVLGVREHLWYRPPLAIGGDYNNDSNHSSR
ncbi:MAG TPA: hypothetical protein VMW03_09365 [Candidatus Krumholzibacteriaceae bacterium]|nr:hypothetical protein [Candidatus Krumholzibacteriaceae bacterium]